MPRMQAGAYITALPPVIGQQSERDAYHIYLTDALKLIAENTAKISRGEYLNIRFTDIIHPKPEETRTADEIIQQVLGGLMEK